MERAQALREAREKIAALEGLGATQTPTTVEQVRARVSVCARGGTQTR